jgi:hypothetical protein
MTQMSQDEFFDVMTALPPTWVFEKSAYNGGTETIRDTNGRSPIVAAHQKRFPNEIKWDVYTCAEDLGLCLEDAKLLIKAEDGRATNDTQRALRTRMLDAAELAVMMSA